MFKRRSKRSYSRLAVDSVYPRGGWTRAIHYFKHRVRRLPDSSHSIARGLFAGIFISFTPLFGLHFIGAAVVAKVVRGNVLAALLATFVVNPVTLPLVAYTSLKLGHLILGTRFSAATHESLLKTFADAGVEVKNNFLAMFTEKTTQWGSLVDFFHEAFLPYLVGGIGPGIIAGLIFYYLSEPVIAAYQKHRRKKIVERMEKLRAKAAPPAATGPADVPAEEPARNGPDAA